MTADRKRRLLVALVVAAALVAAFFAWRALRDPGLPEGIAGGNGRIEAVEIDIAAKAPGRIAEILVDEGDLVEEGQLLARIDTVQLEARRRQAVAQLRRAKIGVETAHSLVEQREAEKRAAQANVTQAKAQLRAAEARLDRTKRLVTSSTVSQQVLDDDLASEQSVAASVAAAEARLAASKAAIGAAHAQVIDAEAAVDAAKAAIETIDADIADSDLTAPRAGRVQYRVAQPGEVVAAGGRVLNLVDLSNVHMTFFLPTVQAGRVAIGSDARIVLDAAPEYVIPATATFVADVAQFTPKTVETEEERQKLMFRVKATIPQDLLLANIRQVKTGLPGMAYVKIDPNAAWPEALAHPISAQDVIEIIKDGGAPRPAAEAPASQSAGKPAEASAEAGAEAAGETQK